MRTIPQFTLRRLMLAFVWFGLTAWWAAMVMRHPDWLGLSELGPFDFVMSAHLLCPIGGGIGALLGSSWKGAACGLLCEGVLAFLMLVGYLGIDMFVPW